MLRPLKFLIGSIVISLSRCCLPNDEGLAPQYFFLEPPLHLAFCLQLEIVPLEPHASTYDSAVKSQCACAQRLIALRPLPHNLSSVLVLVTSPAWKRPGEILNTWTQKTSPYSQWGEKTGSNGGSHKKGIPVLGDVTGRYYKVDHVTYVTPLAGRSRSGTAQCSFISSYF